ncbi:MAG: hypothetical protein ABSD70_04170 [Terracidiphilus sp.]|jgi:hypothetical protein
MVQKSHAQSILLVRVLARGIFLAMVLASISPAVFASAPTQPCIQADRWLEIDLYWFRQHDQAASVREFWNRFRPLFMDLCGYRGVILNVGWTVGPVMEWSGNLDQRISLPAGSGQSEWVDEHEMLKGTTAGRQKLFEERFASPTVIKRHGYDPWTYGDLKQLSGTLKAEAAHVGVPDFKVGILNYAWTDAYGEEAAWVKRHPEAFTKARPPEGTNFDPGSYFDPGALLHSDARPLGGLPAGIPEGMPVHKAYAAQWGSLSHTLGLDAIMLRDSFGMPVPYRRAGPWGPVAPSPALIRNATANVAALVREVKQANPAALVMMYSNGACAISDWRSNGLDLESVARQGYLDIFVDQTWAGAWNEVGVRDHAFWNAPTKGWTYQLAYMLTHAAVLADTKVRHYPLVETFDAWESWDVIHTAPEKLRWGIWAYSHAAVKTPRGLKFPVGTYISWANQGERLLSENDVQFLATNINAAIADARQTNDVLGPTLVYNRAAMHDQAEHASADGQINEWIDEQLGSLIKWPVPILSSTRIEWLPQVHSDLFVVQTPAHLSGSERVALAKMIGLGQPIAFLGSAAGGVDPSLAQLAGLQGRFDAAPVKVSSCRAINHAAEFARNSEDSFNSFCYPLQVEASKSAHVIYEAGGTPELTLDTAGGKRVAFWNPPDLRSTEGKPLSWIWQNTGTPYALAAGVMNDMLKTRTLHAQEIDLQQTVNIAAWRTRSGQIHILAGNLEEGLRDDADLSRHVNLEVPAGWSISRWKDLWSGRTVADDGFTLPIDLPQASSMLFESSR